jgi:hypothetical protein
MKKWIVILLMLFLLIGCGKPEYPKFQDGEIVTISVGGEVGQVYSHFMGGGIYYYKVRYRVVNNKSSALGYKKSVFKEFELEKNDENAI